MDRVQVKGYITGDSTKPSSRRERREGDQKILNVGGEITKRSEIAGRYWDESS